jgi:E3 ubiquitin-protein ligase HUWE1
LLISGLPEIDFDDLEKNTEYHGYGKKDQVIQWFWKVVKSFSKNQKALFVQFFTGTSKVPIGGFADLVGMSGLQKFNIHKAHDKDRLPSAHTCFNQLDLPDYPSEEILRQKLLLAIHEGSEGFGFV